MPSRGHWRDSDPIRRERECPNPPTESRQCPSVWARFSEFEWLAASECLPSRSAVRRRKARARRCSSSLLPEKRRWMRLVLARACREVRRAVLTCESAKLWREGRRLEGTFRNSDSPTLSTKETKHGAHSQTQTNGRSFRVNPHRYRSPIYAVFPTQTRILWLNEMPTVDQNLNVATNSCAVEP